MTHGRKPRKPRARLVNPRDLAREQAGLHTPQEIAALMAPLVLCAKLLREGVATEHHHQVLYSGFLIAQGIERSRVVRGLQEHLAAAMQAMDAIGQRARASGEWKQTPLYYQELDHINTAVDLHEFQLGQVARGELHAIVKKLINTTRSAGETVERIQPEQLGLLAA